MLRRSLSSASSRRVAKFGYVYASAGRGESSSDVVFSGKAIVAEQGRLLVANDRWNPDDNCVIADIDIEALRHDRIHSSTFADCARRRRASGAEAHGNPARKSV